MKTKNWRERLVSPAEAAALIRSGDNLASSMAGGIPYLFLDALADISEALRDVTVYMASPYKYLKLIEPEHAGHVDICSFFLGAWERESASLGSNMSFQPLHLSALRQVFTALHPPRVAIVSGAPPDEDGFISLGPCPLDREIIDAAQLVIVQINENLPYIRGTDCMIHVDDVDVLVDGTEETPPCPPVTTTEADIRIGAYIAERIPDGACIQLGIGRLGTAVANQLRDKRDLGIHTDMFSEPMMELIKCGAVNNSKKKLCPGQSVFGFAYGSGELYRFLDHNPAVTARPFAWVNDPRVIAQNDNVVSVNSAMQIDLTGQVCAESIGCKQYSGTGGQLDFVRGAAWSRGGMSFIALPSARYDKSGMLVSKISCMLPTGSAVTTPRTDVQFVVTEYGVADLRGETLDSRARELISIAHPDFREELSAQARYCGLII